MGRYPAEALDLKFEWMRAKQRKKQEREARRAERKAALVERKIEPGRVVPLPPDPPLLPKMLRVKQVAEILGVSRQTIERWFEKRAVVVQGGNHRMMLIPQRTLDDWIREHTAR